jgi:hypothetical protein
VYSAELSHLNPLATTELDYYAYVIQRKWAEHHLWRCHLRLTDAIRRYLHAGEIHLRLEQVARTPQRELVGPATLHTDRYGRQSPSSRAP